MSQHKQPTSDHFLNVVTSSFRHLMGGGGGQPASFSPSPSGWVGGCPQLDPYFMNLDATGPLVQRPALSRC